MRLSTYNFLTSKSIRGVKVGYPLKLHVLKHSEIEAEYNGSFMERFLTKLDWPAVVAAAEVVGLSDDIPKQLNMEDVVGNQEILQKLHHLLMEIDILEGKLECPETGRIFPITDGIPNMLLNEDEV